MKIFKVGFKSSVCYSVNMIWANTGKEEREAVEETAARRAERYGYEVAFVEEISEAEANSNLQKGMPYYSIDEQAERDHDPSFATETETETTESTEGGEESAPAFTITKNDQFSSVEVSFSGKPSAEVRDALKALRFRWHGQKKVWYGYATEEAVRAAIEGQSGEEASTTPVKPHTGADGTIKRSSPSRARMTAAKSSPIPGDMTWAMVTAASWSTSAHLVGTSSRMTSTGTPSHSRTKPTTRSALPTSSRGSWRKTEAGHTQPARRSRWQKGGGQR